VMRDSGHRPPRFDKDRLHISHRIGGSTCDRLDLAEVVSDCAYASMEADSVHVLCSLAQHRIEHTCWHRYVSCHRCGSLLTLRAEGDEDNLLSVIGGAIDWQKCRQRSYTIPKERQPKSDAGHGSDV
jgi:hypothetical protein